MNTSITTVKLGSEVSLPQGKANPLSENPWERDLALSPSRDDEPPFSLFDNQ